MQYGVLSTEYYAAGVLGLPLTITVKNLNLQWRPTGGVTEYITPPRYGTKNTRILFWPIVFYVFYIFLRFLLLLIIIVHYQYILQNLNLFYKK